MKRYLAVAVAACVVSLVVPAIPAQAAYVKCADESPNIHYQNSEERHCKKVRRLIREFFPEHAEEWAISCFSSESGLDKWAHFKESSPYKGVAQMGRSERQSTGWGWRLEKQIEAAYLLYKSRGTSPWYGYAC